MICVLSLSLMRIYVGFNDILVRFNETVYNFAKITMWHKKWVKTIKGGYQNNVFTKNSQFE